MSSEADQAATNATILAKLDNMEQNQQTLIQGLNDTRHESADGREVIRTKVDNLALKVQEAQGDNETLNEKLDGHIDADGVQFRLLWKLVLGGTSAGSLLAIIVGRVIN